MEKQKKVLKFNQSLVPLYSLLILHVEKYPVILCNAYFVHFFFASLSLSFCYTFPRANFLSPYSSSLPLSLSNSITSANNLPPSDLYFPSLPIFLALTLSASLPLPATLPHPLLPSSVLNPSPLGSSWPLFPLLRHPAPPFAFTRLLDQSAGSTGANLAPFHLHHKSVI